MPTPSPPRKRRASPARPGHHPISEAFPSKKSRVPSGTRLFGVLPPQIPPPSLPGTELALPGRLPRPSRLARLQRPAPRSRSRSPHHRCKEKCKVSDFFTLLRKHSQLTDSVIVTDTKFLFPPDNVGFLYTFPTTHFFRKSFPIFSTVSFPEGYNSIPLP
jgi:hypothetical protein